jgi:hypothetical protein
MKNYLMLILLFATVIGIALLNMTEDPKPTIKMEQPLLVEAEDKKEVKKEIIPEPVIEEVIEPEVKTDPPELKSVLQAIGAISVKGQPLDKYYLIVASFLDNDLAFDYAEKLILSGSNVIIIPPFSTSKLTRVALLEYETLEKANIGLDKYKDEFDDKLWVLKY